MNKGVMVTRNSGDKLKLIPDKKNYSTRDKVTMKINTQNRSGKAIGR